MRWRGTEETIEKTIKLKLVPITKRDRSLLSSPPSDSCEDSKGIQDRPHEERPKRPQEREKDTLKKTQPQTINTPIQKVHRTLRSQIHEYGLEARRIDARRTSITGPTTRTRARGTGSARKNLYARIAGSSSTHSMSHA